jgi:hypothetical protein
VPKPKKPTNAAVLNAAITKPDTDANAIDTA